jgi:hypothetical protein
MARAVRYNRVSLYSTCRLIGSRIIESAAYIRNCFPIYTLTVHTTRRLIETFSYCYHFCAVFLISGNINQVDLDEATKTTLTYIRGNVIRKIMNHTSCQICTQTLIENVKEQNTSSFVLQMDFNGNSLLEPSSQMMVFFHLLLSVYVHLKPGMHNIRPAGQIWPAKASNQAREAQNLVYSACFFHKNTI